MRRFDLRLLLVAMLAALGLATPSLAAGGLAVSPVSLIFSADGRAQALEVSNPGDAATEVQVRLFAWRLDEGADRLEPSAELGFSPPMFRLEPGARQLVRIASLIPVGGRERAYRLFVDQLPQAPRPGELQMPVRMALPLFVGTASTDPAPALQWRVRFDAAAGQAEVVAANPGSRRVKVTDLVRLEPGAAIPVAPGLSGYVLAGQSRRWVTPWKGPARALDLRFRGEAGDISARAEVDAP